MHKGHRIETTGEGRTAKWPRYTGVVERVTKRAVFVRWDGLHFSDQMDVNEVRVIEEMPCTTSSR